MVTELKNKTIVTQLLDDMSKGKYKDKDRLPSEKKLALNMNVTRSKIREALVKLEREGFVTRKLGIGTIINRHVLSMTNRMDMEKEFKEMVIDAGYTPGIKYCIYYENDSNEELKSKLSTTSKEGIISIERVVTANNIPVILCIDTLSKAITQSNSLKKDIDESVFKYLAKSGVDSNTCLTDIKAECVDESLSEKLEIKKGDAILKITETGYDKFGKPVICSEVYYVNGYIKPKILRKRI